MSKTKRAIPTRKFEVNPLRRHIRQRMCDGCGLWYDEEDVFDGKDEHGRPIGKYCESCI